MQTMSLNSPHGGGASPLPLMSWSRQSGAPAVLLSRAPPAASPGYAPPHGGFAHGLDTPFLSQPVTPASLHGDGHAAMTPRMAAKLAACGSPRALGDVPMLLSEQRRWGSCVAVSDASAAALAMMAAEAAQEQRRWAPASPDELQAAAMARCGPRRYESFGADSKVGFDEGVDPAVLASLMDADSDAD
jgi:hypothetical protein